MLIHAVLWFSWFEPKIAILEKQIRKKLKDSKDLPLANMFIKKFKDKDPDFCPADYLDNEEKYLETMKKWKNDFENEFVEGYPHLGRIDSPVRHNKFTDMRRN